MCDAGLLISALDTGNLLSDLLLFCRLGAHKIYDIAKEIEVENITTRENYNSRTFANDIALLKLKTPAIIHEGVGLVCLPNLDLALEPGKKCYITGWEHYHLGDTNQMTFRAGSVSTNCF